MAISHQNTYAANSESNLSSVVVSSGTGRVLMYTVLNVEGATSWPSSVTYGGVALSSWTKLLNADVSVGVQVWYLLDPAVGTANITANGGSAYYACSASVFDGVNTASYAAAFGTAATAEDWTDTPSISVAGGADKWIYAACFGYADPITWDSPSTARGASENGNNPDYLRTATNATGNNPQTVSGTFPTSRPWAIWGVAMNPASSATWTPRINKNFTAINRASHW